MLALVAGTLVPRVRAAAPAPVDDVIASAFQSAYNLDRPAALDAARHAVAMAPTLSRAHRTLAAVLWLDMLYERGALTVDAYLGGLTKGHLALPPPNPDRDAEFLHEITQAINLASAVLDTHEDDVQARYDLGAAYGLEASYRASIKGSTSAAFSAARHAFDAQEAVLDEDPDRVGAGLVVGTYRYLVSIMALPARMFAYLAGFGGGKDQGIELVEAAERDPQTRVEAKTALVLIYTREHRHRDALRLLTELADEFPRNRLFVYERGAAALRAGQSARANDILTQGIEALSRDDRPKIPGEQAMWLYKRGEARLAMYQRADAVADLEHALATKPVAWIRGRIEVALGHAADLEGARDRALDWYRRAAETSRAADDPDAQAAAARGLKAPFTDGR
jgi:tetratricopeptide (TPR) repeat protein